MLPSTPSHTALRVALRRAAHQLHDRPLILADPFAVAILGDTYADALQRTPASADRPWSKALRAFLVVRSRYAEDALHQAVAEGTAQYVLLGAGLDTFAHRNPYPHLRVFEVDHPSSQTWKQSLLAGGKLSPPSRLTYVPVDFETQHLSTQLLNSGFDPAAPTFFSWLGVVPYLTLQGFRATVAALAELPAAVSLVLDYGQPRAVLPYLEQLAHDSLAARVQQRGEPFQLFFTPSEIAAHLAPLRVVEDLGRDEINARYFTIEGVLRPDQLQVRGQAGRLLLARSTKGSSVAPLPASNI